MSSAKVLCLAMMGLFSSCSNESNSETYGSDITEDAESILSDYGSAWSLRDMGGGGSSSAMVVGPYIFSKSDDSYSNAAGDLFVGSDESGIYTLPAGSEDFIARHQGLVYDKVGLKTGLLSIRGSSTHIQGIDVVPDPELVIVSTQGGVIYRSEDRGNMWQPVFDVAKKNDIALFKTSADKIFFGPVAISDAAKDGKHTVAVGIGQPKHLRRGKEKASRSDGLLKALPKELRYKVLLSEDSGKSWQLVGLCKNDCPSSKDDNGHVVSIAATDQQRFWVATLGGLFLLSKNGTKWQAVNKSPGAPKKPQSWQVLSVQPNARNPSDVLVLTSGGSTEKYLWQTNHSEEENITWKNVTGNLGQGLDAVSDFGPFVKMLRSKSRPSEVVVTGSKNDMHGVFFSADFAKGEWISVVNREDVKTFAARVWSRFSLERERAFSGAGEIAIQEDKNGIRRIYAAGFLGMILKCDRRENSNEFAPIAIHARQVSGDDEKPKRYSGAGEISLGSSKGGVLIDKTGGPLTAFLYGDNGMFITRDQGISFSRPIEDWYFGRTGMIMGDRVAINFSKGNHPEQAANGGIRYSSDGGKTFQDLDLKGLPKKVLNDVTLSRSGNELFTLAEGRGVYRTVVASGGTTSWKEYSEGFSGRESTVEYLREDFVDSKQVLLTANRRSANSMDFHYRFPTDKKSKWRLLAIKLNGSEVTAIKEEFSGIWFQEGNVAVLTVSNKIMLGKLSKSKDDDGYQLKLDRTVSAPVVTISDQNKSKVMGVEMLDVALCGNRLFSATSDGIYARPLDGTQWVAFPRIPYRPTWGIATDSACNLFASAAGAGNYLLSVKQSSR